MLRINNQGDCFFFEAKTIGEYGGINVLLFLYSASFIQATFLERVGIKLRLYLFPLIQPSPSGEGFKICVATSPMVERAENRAP